MSKGRAGRTTDHRLESMTGPPIKSFPPRRVCIDAECATVLSIYNGTALCALHQRLGRIIVRHAV